MSDIPLLWPSQWYEYCMYQILSKKIYFIFRQNAIFIVKVFHVRENSRNLYTQRTQYIRETHTREWHNFLLHFLPHFLVLWLYFCFPFTFYIIILIDFPVPMYSFLPSFFNIHTYKHTFSIASFSPFFLLAFFPFKRLLPLSYSPSPLLHLPPPQLLPFCMMPPDSRPYHARGSRSQVCWGERSCPTFRRRENRIQVKRQAPSLGTLLPPVHVFEDVEGFQSVGLSSACGGSWQHLRAFHFMVTVSNGLVVLCGSGHGYHWQLTGSGDAVCHQFTCTVWMYIFQSTHTHTHTHIIYICTENFPL